MLFQSIIQQLSTLIKYSNDEGDHYAPMRDFLNNGL